MWKSLALTLQAKKTADRLNCPSVSSDATNTPLNAPYGQPAEPVGVPRADKRRVLDLEDRFDIVALQLNGRLSFR